MKEIPLDVYMREREREKERERLHLSWSIIKIWYKL